MPELPSPDDRPGGPARTWPPAAGPAAPPPPRGPVPGDNLGYGWVVHARTPPPPPPLTRPPDRRRWGPVALVVGTVLAIAAVAVVVLLPGGGPSHPDEWDPRVADLAGFVERERGLDFEHPVYVDFLTADDYADQVRVDESVLTGADRDEMESAVAVLRALGLASGDVDLFEAGNDIADDGTLAFYNPGTERIIVRGTALTVGLEATLVHELTHALQDQHFDLGALQEQIYTDAGLDPDSSLDGVEDDLLFGPDLEADLAESTADAAFSGYLALVEGDAVRIENAYVESLPGDELDEYVRSVQDGLDQVEADLADVPSALRAFQIAPYALGQPLVDLVGADGGNAAIDGMFADHPSTEEHLLSPPTYVGRERPGDLPQPELPPGAEPHEIVDQGTMGAVELFVVLAERIDPIVALDAADGWANATFVAWEHGLDGTCVRVLVDGDTPDDDAELRSALTAWAGAAPEASGAEVENVGPERTLVESCDPGSGGAPANERALDALTVPAVRSQIAFFAADAGTDLDAAWEAGDCFVHQLSFDQMVVINELTDEAPPDLQAVIDDAFTTCAPA